MDPVSCISVESLTSAYGNEMRAAGATVSGRLLKAVSMRFICLMLIQIRREGLAPLDNDGAWG